MNIDTGLSYYLYSLIQRASLYAEYPSIFALFQSESYVSQKLFFQLVSLLRALLHYRKLQNHMSNRFLISVASFDPGKYDETSGSDHCKGGFLQELNMASLIIGCLIIIVELR